METRHLVYLEAVVAHGSISAAARACDLTQSALTKIVARVELELGVSLFERRARGVVPTPLGERFFSHVPSLQRTLRDIASESAAFRAGMRGTIAVGAGQSWLNGVLPTVLAEFHGRCPEVEVSIRTGSRQELLDQLREGRLDIVLGAIVGEEGPDLKAEPLLKIGLRLAMRERHPLARRGATVRLQDLAAYHWVLSSRQDPHIVRLFEAFRHAGLSAPKVAIESVSYGVASRVLRASDLLSILPDVLSDEDREGLISLDVEGLTWIRTAGIVVRRERALSPSAEIFLERLRHHARALGGDESSGDG